MPGGAGAHVPGLHLACEEAQLARRGDRVLDTRRGEMDLGAFDMCTVCV